MKYNVNVIVFPEGDIQEIKHRLRFNDCVDINGVPIHFPLATSKVIGYAVYKITSRLERNEDITEYHLRLLSTLEIDDMNKQARIKRE